MMIKTKRLKYVLLLVVILGMLPGTPGYAEVNIKINDNTHIGIDGLFRTYLLNDQRLQWSGIETTFGAEAVLKTSIRKNFKWGRVSVGTELFFNQPVNKNILADDSRQKYLQNFQIDTLELKQLYIKITRGDFSIALGKQPSIFGRNYTQRFSNAFFDYPFIRNEAILNYETGLFLSYKPGILSIEAAVVNGSEDMDTNSSKGGLARIGLEGKNWSFGLSAKVQDGIGSEWQKQYNNHAGVDFMIKLGAFRFASEVIYDEYGLHREFPIDDVFWGRSYYYRDINWKHKTPITGVGGYLDLQYEKEGFLLELNYGEYYPKEIGHIYHDDPIKRGLVKIKVRIVTDMDAFGVGLFEGKREKEPLFEGASDYGFLLGLQYRL